MPDRLRPTRSTKGDKCDAAYRIAVAVFFSDVVYLPLFAVILRRLYSIAGESRG